MPFSVGIVNGGGVTRGGRGKRRNRVCVLPGRRRRRGWASSVGRGRGRITDWPTTRATVHERSTAIRWSRRRTTASRRRPTAVGAPVAETGGHGGGATGRVVARGVYARGLCTVRKRRRRRRAYNKYTVVGSWARGAAAGRRDGGDGPYDTRAVYRYDGDSPPRARTHMRGARNVWYDYTGPPRRILMSRWGRGVLCTGAFALAVRGRGGGVPDDVAVRRTGYASRRTMYVLRVKRIRFIARDPRRGGACGRRRRCR